MSHQERKALFNLLTYFVVFAIYANYVYTHYWDPTMSTDELLVFWAKALLVTIPLQIISHIVIHILLNIGRGMANGGKLVEDKEDEFDKIIDLKASRVSMFFFAIGFMVALGFLAYGEGINHFFISILLAGVLAEILEAISRVVMYRRGV